MYFENNISGGIERKNTKLVYDMCSNLTVILREKFSYDTARSLLRENIRCELITDIVLSKKVEPDNLKRKIPAICLKSDIESILSEDIKEQIKSIVKDKFSDFEEISMHHTENISIQKRPEIISDKIKQIQKCNVIVTDTLNCMILCAVSCTPCVFFNNISREIEGVYEWIKDLEYVKFIDNPKKLSDSITEVLSAEKVYNFDYKPYFEKLQQIVKE